MAIGAAIAGTVGAIGGGLLGKAGAKKARKAYDAAGNLISEQFATTEEQMMPWMEVGQDALYQMSRELGLPDGSGMTDDGFDFSGFETSPGYTFRQEEGQKAVERSAAGRGMLQSGAAIKDLQRFSQGLASEEYGNWYNRRFNEQQEMYDRKQDYMRNLMGVSEAGRSSTVQLGQMRGNAAANQANMMAGAGEARATGYQSLGNAATSIGETWATYAGTR